MKFSNIIALFIFFTACSSQQTLNDAQIIIDKSIEVHGGVNYDNLHAEFDFRDRHYILDRKGGRTGSFSYTRLTPDSLGMIKDVLKQASQFQRYLDDQPVVISEERKAAFTSSVNSVLYFVQLPYPLNDAAVIKEFIGEAEVEGNSYYKIRVTFNQAGGGEDYEDIFCYWINKETFTMDYIAYSYLEEEGPGTRFRKAINRKEIKGIIFQDYINYKPLKHLGTPPVEEHDNLFQNNQLEELSQIINTNIEVNGIGTPS